MTTATDTTPVSLADQIGAKLPLKVDEARGLYVELLGRNGDPQPGDRELLERVLHTLGRTPEQYVDDLRAMAEVRYLEQQNAEERAPAHERLRVATDALAAHKAETKRIMEERTAAERALEVPISNARQDVAVIDHRAQRIAELKRAAPLAFGLLLPAEVQAQRDAEWEAEQRRAHEGTFTRQGAPSYREGEEPRPFTARQEVQTLQTFPEDPYASQTFPRGPIRNPSADAVQIPE